MDTSVPKTSEPMETGFTKIEKDKYALYGQSMTPARASVLPKSMAELANETINRPSFFDQLKQGKD